MIKKTMQENLNSCTMLPKLRSKRYLLKNVITLLKYNNLIDFDPKNWPLNSFDYHTLASKNHF